VRTRKCLKHAINVKSSVLEKEKGNPVFLLFIWYYNTSRYKYFKFIIQSDHYTVIVKIRNIGSNYSSDIPSTSTYHTHNRVSESRNRMTWTGNIGLIGEIETTIYSVNINPLNAELNPICHLLTLLGGATIVVFSRLRVKH